MAPISHLLLILDRSSVNKRWGTGPKTGCNRFGELFVIVRKRTSMTRKELTDVIAAQVAEVINNPVQYGEDPQLSIIPTTLLVGIERHHDALRDIEYSDYAIEADAVEDGDYSEDAADFQSASDPDLIPIGTLIDYANKKPDLQKIARLVAQYIPEEEENLYAE